MSKYRDGSGSVHPASLRGPRARHGLTAWPGAAHSRARQVHHPDPFQGSSSAFKTLKVMPLKRAL